MPKLNVTLKGQKELLNKLSNISKEVDKEVSTITQINALDIERNAKQIAPIDTGRLRQSIKAFEVDKKTWGVGAFARYAPYIEFGTGGSVEVPNELKDLAIQFKGRGIKRINLPARPFLYPSFLRGRKNYVKDLTELLKRVVK